MLYCNSSLVLKRGIFTIHGSHKIFKFLDLILSYQYFALSDSQKNIAFVFSKYWVLADSYLILKEAKLYNSQLTDIVIPLLISVDVVRNVVPYILPSKFILY